MSKYTYLAHYGIKDQKWGLRRFQNEDGSLTPEGRIRYGVAPHKNKKFSLGELAVHETGYQVSKLTKPVKSAARSVKNAAKQSFDWQHRVIRREKYAAAKKARKEEKLAAKKLKKEEKSQEKAEKFEAKKEKLAQDLIDRNNKRMIKDLKSDIDNSKLEDARSEVARLTAKRDRLAEEAMLKEEAKRLKQEMKTVKKEAKETPSQEETYSRKQIRSLSDQELDARIQRLKKEAELVRLESTRNTPESARRFVSAVTEGASGAIKNIASDTVTSIGKSALKSIGLYEITKETKSAFSGAALAERREKERRAKAFKDNDLTIAEIADRMNISEGQVKDLLYVK